MSRDCLCETKEKKRQRYYAYCIPQRIGLFSAFILILRSNQLRKRSLLSTSARALRAEQVHEFLGWNNASKANQHRKRDLTIEGTWPSLFFFPHPLCYTDVLLLFLSPCKTMENMKYEIFWRHFQRGEREKTWIKRVQRQDIWKIHLT